ncbi:MAG: class I SAM-dependent methyltransferase [Ignavibacteriaceae bacterium]|nr:class I SAM-dependent methyltransferase [Ignavibacteriaceae bacterium]
MNKENSCPVCRSSEKKRIGKPMSNPTSEKFLRYDFNVVQCKACQTFYVDPLIDFTPDEWKQLYNSGYFGYNTEWLINQREKDLQHRFLLLDKMKSGGEVNFLDIGCGEGNALMHAVKRNWNATAVDITDLRKPAAKNNPAIKFIESDLPGAGLAADTYNVAYLDSVLEHVLNPLEYLNEIKRILAPGGIVYIGIPNEDSLLNTARKLAFLLKGRSGYSVKLRPFDAPYHVVGFNNSSANNIIRKAGLKKVYFRNFGRKFDFLGFKPGTFEYFQALAMLPVEFLGWAFRKDNYFEMILRKE